jgi:hypothetical protein
MLSGNPYVIAMLAWTFSLPLKPAIFLGHPLLSC